MRTDYDVIAGEYRQAKQQPWRMHVESYTLFDLLGELSGKTVLDLACGEGFHTRGLKQRGAAHVVGVDASAGMIELARPATWGRRCSRLSLPPRRTRRHA
jgi:ubiquinone/menaquinone biosynthesis C-methylase UbiE